MSVYLQKAGEDISQAFETLSGILDVWSKKPELFEKYRNETCILNRMETDSTDDNIVLPEIKKRLEEAVEALDMLQFTLDFHVGAIKEKSEQH